MRREWGFWLLLMGMALAGGPLLWPGFPPSHDGVLHVYRVLEMDRMWRAGVLYPRWAPDLVFGLGYPLFHFHGPMFPWLGALGMQLGLDLEVSVKVVLAILIAFGGTGAYRLARRWGIHELGAMAAGLAYVYTPFRIRELYWQGDFPQYLALSLLPWAMEALHAYLEKGGWSRRWGSSAIYALLLLSHNITAMLGTLALLGYGAVVWFAARPPRRRVWGAAMALATGVGLAAFFVFPALLDRPLVYLDRLLQGHFDFRKHFLGLDRLLAFVPLRDQSQGNPQEVLTLGGHQVLMAIASFLAWRRWGHAQRILAVGAGLGLAGMIGLMMKPSRFIWEHVPLLAYVEFPWRWLGIAGLPIALLIGLGVHGLQRRGWRALGAALTGLALVLGIAPLLYPFGRFTVLHRATLADLQAFDRAAGLTGLTSVGELLPRTVAAKTISGSPLEAAYHRGEEPVRLDSTVLPPGAAVRPLSLHPLDQRYAVRLLHGTTLRFWVFAFPGWQVQVDGRPVPAWAAGELGLLHAHVPPGEHEVRLWFPGRWDWRLLELFSLGLWVSGGIRWLRGRVKAALCARELHPVVSLAPSWGERAGLVVFWTLILGVKFLYVDPHTTWFRPRSNPNTPPGMVTRADVDFGGRIRLLGYTLSTSTGVVRPGETLTLILWWRGLQAMDVQYSVYVHGLEALPPNRLRFQSDHMHPGEMPTTAPPWREDRYIQDVHLLSLPADLPPGPYRIKVGLYERGKPGATLPTANGENGYFLPLTLTVNRPMPAAARLPQPIRFGGMLELVGAELPTLVPPNAPWTLWLYWRAVSPMSVSYVLFVHRLDAQGQMRGQRDGPPYWGTDHWPVGEIIAVPVTLEGVAEPGTYRMRIGWYEWPSMRHLTLPSGETFFILPAEVRVR